MQEDTASNYIVISSHSINLGANDDQAHWYVSNGGKIEGPSSGDGTGSLPVTVTGDVHLILKNGTTLNAQNGISIAHGSSLTIYREAGNGEAGELSADHSLLRKAGISLGTSESNLTIHGGTVSARGEENAGIRCTTGGTVTIYGGTVNASSNDTGAGIGGGSNAAGGTVNISGGMVTATGACSGIGRGTGSIFGNAAGTFSTGEDGNAIIIATATNGGDYAAISDNGDTSKWSGLIVQNNSGKIYGTGTAITLSQDLNLKEDTLEIGTLEMSQNQRLTVGENVTLKIGTLNNTGGTLTNNGTIEYGSQLALSLVDESGAAINANNVPAGSTVKVKATLTTSAPLELLTGKTVSFTVGSEKKDLEFKETDEAGTYTATTEAMTLSAGENQTITASFAGVGETTDPTDGNSGKIVVAASPVASLTVTVAQKTQPTLTLTADPETLTGGGTVTLTATAEYLGDGQTISVSGEKNGENGEAAQAVSVTPGEGNTWTANLPNETASYTFTARVEETSTHEAATAECTVSVTEESFGVNVSATEGGRASADKTTAKQGETVMLTQAASDGYHFVGWKVTPEDLTIADNSFTMSAANVSIQAVFEKDPAPSVPSGPSTPSEPDDQSPEIDVSEPDHGSVEIDNDAPEAGDTVTITPKPDDGYEVEEVIVTDEDGNRVPVTENPDGSWSYEQPESDVTIEVIFGEIEPEPTTDVSEIFIDVAPDAWYKDAVQYAYDQGLMTGVSDTEFAPEATTTRAMIVSILARLENVTSAESAGFADVDDNDWYATAVNWAASVSVVNGFEDNTFRPNDAITREQLAAILMNYAAYKGENVSARADLSVYSDQPSAWATETMQWAVAEGLISGVTADQLQPQASATRAQVAAILQRFLSI